MATTGAAGGYNILLNFEFTKMSKYICDYQTAIEKYNPKTIVEKLMNLEKIYDSTMIAVFLPSALVLVYLVLFFICNF